MSRIAIIRERLENALSPMALSILDESHKHAGHAGAADGRGHFRIDIQSSVFNGLKQIERHRLIYAALGELMQSDIHALSITARDGDI